MNKAKRARLAAAGIEEIDVQDWLGLSDVDMEVIDLKVAMAKAVIDCRKSKRLSQKKLAALMESSQSRVSAMEKGDSSIELMARALFTLGVDRKTIAELMAA
ncbi:MAG: helix-turn-helix domain-containing protein [Acidobacteria bacterium]|nr:helix-turn-helix domain-containing protein [Acidobacteriota bacterium]